MVESPAYPAFYRPNGTARFPRHVHGGGTRGYARRMTTTPTGRSPGTAVRLGAPGILLGLGLGGFIDGIVLHQILQWHHLLSSTDTDHAGIGHQPVDTVAGLQANTLADGVFHLGTWFAVLAGLLLLYARLNRSPRPAGTWRDLVGWLLAGWGIFNVAEGLVNHHLLGIHHVRGGPDRLWWDLGFLVLGAALVVAGLSLRRRG